MTEDTSRMSVPATLEDAGRAVEAVTVAANALRAASDKRDLDAIAEAAADLTDAADTLAEVADRVAEVAALLAPAKGQLIGPA